MGLMVTSAAFAESTHKEEKQANHQVKKEHKQANKQEAHVEKKAAASAKK